MASPARVLLVVAIAAWSGWATPAQADANPSPTDVAATLPSYIVSTITTVQGLDPEVGQVMFSADNIGLVLSVSAGHRVDVPGYDGEPYLKIDASGTAWVNEYSVSAWLNQRVYGDVTVPDDIAAAQPQWLTPSWVKIDDAPRTLAWHDHRAHWMQPTLPARVAHDGWIQDWTIPLELDGQRVVIAGQTVLDLAAARAAGVDLSSVQVARAPFPLRRASGVVLIVGSLLAGVVTYRRGRRQRSTPVNPEVA